MAPRPFSIHVRDEDLADLKRRLENTRWPDPIPGAGWDYGADIDYIKDLCDHWANTYDWRATEASLNQYPQFLAEVDGLDIQFWHVRGQGPNPVPLLLTHGWPGSMYEFHHLIPALTNPAAHGGDAEDAFDVVIPSIPGFGWSGHPRERGWGITRVAAAFDTLMTRDLGYDRYFAQGGDWGGMITARLGGAHADHVAGIHLNFITGGQVPADVAPEDEEKAARRNRYMTDESGYANVQGTKPISLAAAQSDSPAGIAAWIVEKFRAWSDCNGDVESVYTRDQLLTNVMFYWAPNSIGSAASIYYEVRRDPQAFALGRVEVPVAVADFPKEILPSARSWVEPRFNITRWTEMPRGGHFAAMEQPELLLADIREFIRDLR